MSGCGSEWDTLYIQNFEVILIPLYNSIKFNVLEVKCYYIQGVSKGIVHILGGGSVDYSE